MKSRQAKKNLKKAIIISAEPSVKTASAASDMAAACGWPWTCAYERKLWSLCASPLTCAEGIDTL